MTAADDLEQRVRRLEEDLAILKQRVAAGEDAQSWIDRVSGSMKGYPEFEQVVQFGAEFRRSQQDTYTIATDVD